MSRGAAGPQCSRQQDRLGNLLARRAGFLGRTSVNLDAIDALCRMRHRQGDQLAIFPRDFAILARNDLIQVRPGLEFLRSELSQLLEQLEIVLIVIVAGHGTPSWEWGHSMSFSPPSSIFCGRFQ